MNLPVWLSTTLLLISSSSFAAEDIFSIRLPEKVGVVEEAYRGTSEKSVILVKSPHGNPVAQQQISQILALLPGRGLLVALEGGTGPCESLQSALPSSAAACKLLADSFLNQSLLSGAEHQALLSGGDRLRLFGIESPELYEKNRLAWENLQQSPSDRAAEFLESRYDAAALSLYSPEMRNWLNEKERWQKKELGVVPYSRLLNDLLVKNGVPPRNAPNFDRLLRAAATEEKIDLPKVDLERKELVKKLEKSLKKPELARLLELSRQLREEKIPALSYYAALDEKILAEERPNYPNLVAYIEIVRLHAEIERQGLLTEIAALEKQLAEKLTPSVSQRELWEAGRLLQDPSGNGAVAEKLADLSGIPFSAEETQQLENWKNRLRRRELFRETAAERQQSWIPLLLTRMEEEKTGTAVLVAGIVHIPSLAETLRREKISYVILSPREEWEKWNFPPPLLFPNNLPESTAAHRNRQHFAAAALALDLLEDPRLENETAARLNDLQIEKIARAEPRAQEILRSLVPVPELLARDAAGGTLTAVYDTTPAGKSERFAVTVGKLFVEVGSAPKAPPVFAKRSASSLEYLRLLSDTLEPGALVSLVETLRRKSARPGKFRVDRPITTAEEARGYILALPNDGAPLLTQGKTKETSITVRQLKEKEARRIAPLLGENFSSLGVTAQLDFMDIVNGVSFQKLLKSLARGESAELYIDTPILTQEKGKWVRKLLESPTARKASLKVVIASHRQDEDFAALEPRFQPGWKALLADPAFRSRLTVLDAAEAVPALRSADADALQNRIFILDEKTWLLVQDSLDPALDGFPLLSKRGVLRLSPLTRRTFRDAGLDPLAFAGSGGEIELLLEEVQLKQSE